MSDDITEPAYVTPCFTAAEQERTRRNRGSQWDWHIDGEDQEAAKKRRKRSQGICWSCELRVQCLEERERLAVELDTHISGIWGGKAFRDDPDYEPVQAPVWPAEAA